MFKGASQATIELLDPDGVARGSIKLYGDDGTIGVVDDDSREISWADAANGSEVTVSLERVQLLEGHRYDYVLTNVSDGISLDYESNPCVIPHRADKATGRLEPGTYTGLLRLRLLDAGGEPVASGCVDVQSAKAGSLRHYVTMVNDIAQRCSELLMQATSPAQARFESFGEDDAQTLTQRFFFLEALLGRRSFHDALDRIVRNPHIRSSGEMDEKSLSRGGFPIRAGELRQIASRYPRIELPAGHPLRNSVSGIDSLPLTVVTREHRDFTDTPENRFVKHALRTFMHVLEEIAGALTRAGSGGGGGHVADRATVLAEALEERLTHSFFMELSPPDFLPLGSPVLQRREGYREILEAWLRFDLTSQLVWKGGDEVFGAGKRDVAKLYEFWLCFRLGDVADEVFKMEERPELVIPSDNGLELTLESGKSLDWKGRYVKDGVPLLNARFSFNRTFAGQGRSATRAEHGSIVNYKLGMEGAWTAQMRPDYTITLWPVNVEEAQAEKEEQIVHLHFDAKYRVQSMKDSKGSVKNVIDLFSENPAATALDEPEDIAESAGFGEDGESGVDEQEKAEKEGRLSKRADLLKMHAYRDAIRRSEGAYVLYPGTHEKRWAAYHELLPGIGAFPVCPGSNDGMDSVKDFLRSAADLCVDRFSQLYRQRYWTESIMAEEPGGYHEWKPPGLHSAPCGDGVMIGFIRQEAIEVCRKEGIFYFHAVEDGDNKVEFDPRIFTARYLVPFSKKKWLDWWAEIEGVSMVHRKKLERFPGMMSKLKSSHEVEYYYVAKLKPAEDGGFARPYGPDHSAPTIKPPKPGRPKPASWAELTRVSTSWS